MAFEARALYDFDSVGEGELGVKVGDVVTVTDTSLGQGWWMARSGDGREGVVPEAYLERLASGGQEVRKSSTVSSGGWGDDWDSEEEHKYEDPQEVLGRQDSWGNAWPAPPASARPVSASGSTGVPSSMSTPSLSSVQTSQSRPPSVPSRPPPPVKESGFTMGKLSGGWGKGNQVGEYLKGLTETNATIGKEAVMVNETNKEFFMWEQTQEPYSCKIGDPKKGTKFLGAKDFILYPVTPSFSNIQVQRRYKHFDWVFCQLRGKFGSVIAIPPLPEKQITGRFQDDLIGQRKVQLQSFVDRVSRHPVLANSEVWKHFITQTDEKRWTQGKRKAESDNLVGISFLTTIQAPSILSETENSIDNNIGQFTRNMEKMDVAVKNLSTIAVDQTIRTRNAVKKDYQDIGKAFSQLSLAVADSPAAGSLSKIGSCYEDLSTTMAEQATKDWEPVLNMMHDYKGLVSSWKDILGLYNSMADKHKEVLSSGSEKDRDCSLSRFNTYRIGLQSEKNFFNQEVGADLNYVSQVFLVEQIQFHRKMAEKLEGLYHNCWPSAEGDQSYQAGSSSAMPSTSPNAPPVDPLNAWDSGHYQEPFQ